MPFVHCCQPSGWPPACRPSQQVAVAGATLPSKLRHCTSTPLPLLPKRCPPSALHLLLPPADQESVCGGTSNRHRSTSMSLLFCLHTDFGRGMPGNKPVCHRIPPMRRDVAWPPGQRSNRQLSCGACRRWAGRPPALYRPAGGQTASPHHNRESPTGKVISGVARSYRKLNLGKLPANSKPKPSAPWLVGWSHLWNL